MVMQNENLLSIGCAAVEAGVSVSRMERALQEVEAAPVVRVNHVAHYSERETWNERWSTYAGRHNPRAGGNDERRHAVVAKADRQNGTLRPAGKRRTKRGGGRSQCWSAMGESLRRASGPTAVTMGRSGGARDDVDVAKISGVGAGTAAIGTRRRELCGTQRFPVVSGLAVGLHDLPTEDVDALRGIIIFRSNKLRMFANGT